MTVQIMTKGSVFDVVNMKLIKFIFQLIALIFFCLTVVQFIIILAPEVKGEEEQSDADYYEIQLNDIQDHIIKSFTVHYEWDDEYQGDQMTVEEYRQVRMNVTVK